MDETTNQSPESAAALEQLAARKSDPQFVEKYLGGDVSARQEMHYLNQRAFPDPDENHVSSVAHSATEETAPSDPREYRLKYTPGRDVDPVDDREFRAFAHAAKLPNTLAQHMHKLFLEAKDQPRPSEIEIQLKAKSTASRLQNRWGDAYQERLDLARAVLKNVPGEHAKTADKILNRLNVGSNEHLILRLASHAERRGK